MNTDNRNKPAFPDPMRGAEQSYSNQTPHNLDTGLTKREMFAMAAMQGIIAGFDPESKCNGCYIPSCEYPTLMKQATQIADELLKQL